MAGRPLARASVRALARCFDDRDAKGRRTAVPVLGNGLHVQAFGEEQRNALVDPWSSALNSILAEFTPGDRRRLNRLPRSHHGFFDEVARHFRATNDGADPPNPFVARLADELSARIGHGTDLDLYHELALGEFRHILTTCIDDTLPEALDAVRRKPPGVYYEWELYRKSVFRLRDRKNPTDIWQMYGSASMPEGIRLGFDRHADVIAELESQRVLLMNAWRTPSGSLQGPAEFVERRGPFVFNWFKQFMVSPLVFVGTSLDSSDWPMWWLLHQRARVLSVFPAPERPSTFVLTSDEARVDHLVGRPAHIELIAFRDFDELWYTLRRLLQR